MSKKNNWIITTSEISEIFDLTDRRIRQLAKEGALVRVGHGKYDLPLSIRAYNDYSLAKNSSAEELSKSEEEALWTRARRIKTETEIKIMQGDLHRSEDVEIVMNDMLGNFRAKLLLLPAKCASVVQRMDELEPIKEVIKQEVHEALDELSDYDPHAFYSKSQKALSDDGDEYEDYNEDLKESDADEKDHKT